MGRIIYIMMTILMMLQATKLPIIQLLKFGIVWYGVYLYIDIYRIAILS